MGIESDRLVYDYLSRVGDLAQQQHLPAGDRIRLVSGLRDEIDRRRATHGEESPAAVRGILGSLGTPDEVVGRAGAPGPSSPDEPPVPKPRSADDAAPAARPRRTGAPRPPSDRPTGDVPNPRTSGPTAPGRTVPGSTAPGRTAADAPASGATGPGAAKPDWWRKADDDGPERPPLFSGGLERPDLFAPPVEEDDEEETEEPPPAKRRLLARVLRLRKDTAPAVDEEPEAAAEPAARPRLRLGSPFVVLAALLLLGGAVFGSLVALAAGWLLAYASRRLTPTEAKTAVLVIPGLAATAAGVWLWGRVGGRWGAPVAPGGEALGAAISEAWPWTLKAAAVSSALFLLWRSRRP
ncbi:hypothetical protein [Streptomyces sp. SS]|uniref:hypothetical protein n=1 Tax=Streptomyces sp. SS TaxID=260742 RepID=UPI000312FD6A|nr:hypothetical protein [Streptomyces sp. SS]